MKVCIANGSLHGQKEKRENTACKLVAATGAKGTYKIVTQLVLPIYRKSQKYGGSMAQIKKKVWQK